MKVLKWIGGAIGFAAAGPLGAVIGYLIGSMIESSVDVGGEDAPANAGGDARSQEARNSFLISLLVLASYMIRADKRIYKSEKLYVQNFLLRVFGRQAVEQGMSILEELLHKEVPIDPVCRQIADNMSREQRLQLLAFLAEIARADGNVASQEVEALRRIALALRLTAAEAEAMLHLDGDTLDDAYKVLEVEPTATDDQVRRSYKKLVLKYHPDRVATLGADIQREAEEKLKRVNAAYDTVRKQRGF